MRSTMRQLLGGKKGHKHTGDENREIITISSEQNSSQNIVANGLESNFQKERRGIESANSIGKTMNNIGDGMINNGYNHSIPGNYFGNGLAKNNMNGFSNGMEHVNENMNENDVTMGNSMNHGMVNDYGNSLMKSMAMRNNTYGAMGKSNYPMNNQPEEADELNPMNRDWQTPNHSVNHNMPSSNIINSRYDSLAGTQNHASTIPSRSSPVSAASSMPRHMSTFKVENRKIAERSRFISQTPTSPPQIVTGIAGGSEMPSFLSCEDEPIRTPGAIQSAGALIGLKLNRTGDLEVRITSENSRKVLGYGPEQLFALGSFYDVLEEAGRKELSIQIDHCLASGKSKNTYSATFNFFQMTLTFPYEPDCKLWCSLHLAPNNDGLIICEFEEYSENFLLKDVDATRAAPLTQHRSSNEEVDPVEYRKSTTRYSKPIVPLSIARQREDKMFSSLDIFSCMNQIQSQLSACQDIQQLQDVLVGLVSEMTGFHRVMSYRFDSKHNGCVEGEFLNPLASADIFRGLHYPASDIPAQARELYKTNPIRILFDREAETSRLVCRDNADFQQPLDLSNAYLRALSPIHCKYLRNMGVRSSVSISLVIDNSLWGLIACHGYGENGIRISIPIRELCCGIAECASINIQKLVAMERIRARKLPAYIPSNISPPSGDLLKLVDSDFAVLNIGNKIRAIGRMEPFQEANVILNYLQSCRIDKIISSTNINADFPNINCPSGINVLAGLLIIPLNFGKENDFLVFFRKTQVKNINWAGNPHEKVFKSSHEYLEPRMSFQRYIETVSDTSKEWTEDQLDTASILSLLYGKFVETWRMKSTPAPTKEKERENDKGKEKEKEREIEKEKENSSASVDDTFNLKAAATRVLEALKKEAQRKALDLTISIHDELPTVVIGDADCFKQVMLYFIRNGFRSSQSLKVDVNLIRVQDETHHVELKVQDAGPGMSEAELDETFQEFERAQSNEKWPFPNQSSRQNPNDASRGSVTLSVVATFVRSINGQIQVTSELGKGTIFTVDLPYKCAPGTNGSAYRKPRNFITSMGTNKGLINSSPTISGKTIGNERKEKLENTTPTINAFPQLSPALQQSMKASYSQARPQFQSNSKSDDETSTIVNGDGNLNQNLSHYKTIEIKQNTNISEKASRNQLKVLIADNDLASLRILESQFLKMGHTVDIVHDGQECHDRFSCNPNVDAILMELKMPMVDGILSTRMIRIAEKEFQQRNASNNPKSMKKRVPIIALSNKFDEENRFDYIQTGFDGWILKPIDFQRLDLMLKGINDSKARQDALYVPGQIRKGGWFLP